MRTCRILAGEISANAGMIEAGFRARARRGGAMLSKSFGDATSNLLVIVMPVMPPVAFSS
jgi:hypothetical protein